MNKMCIYIYIERERKRYYIYIYIYNLGRLSNLCYNPGRLNSGQLEHVAPVQATVNFPTKIMDFRGFDSSIILIIRGGIFMSVADFPESLSQAILVGIMLVGRLGVSS